MIDVLAANYHDLAYIMETDFDTGMRLMTKALHRQNEGRQWLLYCNLFPNMTKDNFISFEDFCKKQSKPSGKTKEQIMQDTTKIRQLFARK